MQEYLALGRIAPLLLHWAWLPAPQVIAERLDDLTTGGDCLCIEYVLLFDDSPVAVFTNYLRSPEATRIDEVQFRDDFYTLLHTSGVDIASCDLGVQAAEADDNTAGLLHVVPGEPVLLLEQTIRDRTGAAIDYALGTCRNDLHVTVDRIPRIDMTGAVPQ